MAKKRSTQIPGPSSVSKDETGEGSRDYSVGQWAGQMQLKCKRCAFDTLAGEAAMLMHLVEAHGSEAALDALFPGNAPVKTVLLQEPLQKVGDIPEGDLARGVYEIEIEEVGDGTN